MYPILEVRGLTKIYPKVVAVDNVSLEISPGEVVGLVGPNGSGKTTLIESIIGVRNPERGSIRIFGHDRYTDPKKAKQWTSYVPEVPNMVPQLTVWENILFMAAAFGKSGINDRALDLMELFDLLDKKHTVQSQLSKGQAQKVMVISAFIHDPKLMFFDEPLLGIDPKGGKIMKDMIREKREEGVAILISSHMLDLIEEISDRILVMDEGKIVRTGTIEELKEEMLMKDSDFEDVFIKITEG